MKKLLIAFAAFLALTSCNMLDDDKWTPVSIPSSISKQWITENEASMPGSPVCLWDFTAKSGHLFFAFFISTDALVANPSYEAHLEDLYSVECFKKGKTYRLAVSNERGSKFVYYFDDITATSATITGHPYDVYDGKITYQKTATVSPVKAKPIYK